MKSDKKILTAFMLNFVFSIFEFIGGTITGSIAIISDSVHDFGDSITLFISYFLEKISRKAPDEKYTYGYKRFSVLGGFITSLILVLSSFLVIYNSVKRLINPIEINYNGMIIFAIFGTLVNLLAGIFTMGSSSLNLKSVNLHLLEDIFGWITVLIGAVIIKFTGFVFLDPIISIILSLFILIATFKILKSIFAVFLGKVPESIDINKIKEHILTIEGINDVHHFHITSLDGFNNIATMHIVAEGDFATIKKMIKEELAEHGINHSTLEFEKSCEECSEKNCNIKDLELGDNHHHHHHHHH